MKNNFILSFCLLVVIAACSGRDRIVIDGIPEVLKPAVLRMEIVEIPSEGKIVLLDGTARIKKPDTVDYSVVVFDTTVGEYDILWLAEGTVVIFEFDDGSFILNDPKSMDSFITFKVVE
jgi:hypothetical protein